MSVNNVKKDLNMSRMKIEQMVSNQNNLNIAAYAKEWLENAQSGKWDYRMAAIQEIAEFNNSAWLPWWSKGERDIVNCRIELVDALHFMLSQAIATDQEGGAAMNIFIAFNEVFEFENEADEIDWTVVANRSKALTLQLSTLGFDTYSAFRELFRLCDSINFTFDQLHALYMGKSTLNRFRQENGYKAGTYKKKWFILPEAPSKAKEDNYFLSAYVADHAEECGAPPTVEEVHAFLTETYKDVLLAYETYDTPKVGTEA